MIDLVLDPSDIYYYSSDYSLPQYENILHDLKTPMSIIYAYLNDLESTLCSDSFPDSNADYLKSIAAIKKYWFKIMKMISDAMDFDRLNNGLITPALNNLDMVYIIHELVNSTKALSARKGILIEFSTNVDSCVMAVDRFIIERILLNLLSNSVKFTGEHGRIDVILYSDGKTFSFTVRDNGIGIEDANISKIFDKHYTEASELNRNGSGLGLYIVKHLVNLLDGDISVQSCSGTEVTVRIPIRITEASQPEKVKYSNFYNENIVQIELADAY